ncbi:MAG TPA: methyltransferase domain-containing protein [Caulobacteraceae bacterium]
MDYDKTNMPGAYDAGRGYSPEVLAHWLSVIARWAPKKRDLDILDLGCGTGRYCEALAAHFDARVVAIDPSEQMLALARAKATGRVRYQQARGESLPLGDASIDLIFMSMVFHHFDDPARVARECRRVLRPKATVCLRAGTTDQVAGYAHARFFPRTPALWRKDLPSRATITSTFEANGLEEVRHELVPSEEAPNWRAYAAKTGHRASSILIQVSDSEFADGMALLRNFAAGRPANEPVVEMVDFFVFRAP